MSTIELNTGHCQNCYKCIRECPVKAIQFKNGKAEILEKECILCGKCLQACPQNAQFIQDDVEEVKKLLAGPKPVYLTIAPSWQGWFDTDDFSQISAALKKLGFAGVEETAIGAAEVSREYAQLLQEGQMKNIIVTACASVVMLIERYYPDLIKMLAPVSSPMIAHARLMRETYGDIKVVFVGPCLSKMYEVQDPLAGGLVNYALTFQSLERWLKEEKIELMESDPDARGVENLTARLYPKPGGILATIPQTSFGEYRAVTVDGAQRCMELFNTMVAQPELTGMFVEANLCAGGCVGGPIMRMEHKNPILIDAMLDEHPMRHDVNPALTTKAHYPHPRVFANRKVKYPEPTEEEIRKILAKTGKTSPEQELNCGSCGFPTCRAKAIAVFHGKADINMCLPFFRERAENLSNTVIEHSPNAIIAFDEDMMVQELNPTAEEMFHIQRAEAIGFPLPAFYGDNTFDEARETNQPVVTKGPLDDAEMIVEKTVIYIREHRLYIAFLKDISAEQRNEEQLEQLRLHTVEVAQNVIDKQMRVAQEIASLLGETTAETKVALTKLQKSMNTAADK